MITSIKMLTYDEGICYKAYKDTMGKVTVGIGFNMDDSHARDVWQQANLPESFDTVYKNTIPLSIKSVGLLFNTCLANATADIKSLFPDFDTYSGYVQLALINLSFQLGLAALKGFNTTIDLIKQHRFNEAADHLLSSTLWAKQVPQRAKRVTALLKGDDSLYNH